MMMMGEMMGIALVALGLVEWEQCWQKGSGAGGVIRFLNF